MLWNVLTTDERSLHCDCLFISGEKKNKTKQNKTKQQPLYKINE